MTREELEKRVHEFTWQIYAEGYERGHDEGYTKGYAHGKKLAENNSLGKYKKGLEDAWECARKVILFCGEGSYDDIHEIFGTISLTAIMNENTPKEAMQKIIEYEVRQNCKATDCYNCVNHYNCDYEYEEKQTDATDMNDGSIKVGDEVRIKGSDYDCDYGICTWISPFNTMYVMRRDGSSGEENKDKWYKTGRHFPQIAEVLKLLRG